MSNIRTDNWINTQSRTIDTSQAIPQEIPALYVTPRDRLSAVLRNITTLYDLYKRPLSRNSDVTYALGNLQYGIRSALRSGRWGDAEERLFDDVDTLLRVHTAMDVFRAGRDGGIALREWRSTYGISSAGSTDHGSSTYGSGYESASSSDGSSSGYIRYATQRQSRPQVSLLRRVARYLL